jgi:hypothetical protein
MMMVINNSGICTLWTPHSDIRAGSVAMRSSSAYERSTGLGAQAGQVHTSGTYSLYTRASGALAPTVGDGVVQSKESQLERWEFPRTHTHIHLRSTIRIYQLDYNSPQISEGCPINEYLMTNVSPNSTESTLSDEPVRWAAIL